MPGGSGIEALKTLRRSTKTQHITAVVVSGSSDLDEREIAMDLSGADFLPKPVDTDELCWLLSS
jgi:CheY-like chemotaxis protein